MFLSRNLSLALIATALLFAVPLGAVWAEGDSSGKEKPASAASAGERLFLADRLIDAEVKGGEGGLIGEVEDLVIDPARSCVTHVVIIRDDDDEELRVAVPYDAVTIREVKADDFSLEVMLDSEKQLGWPSWGEEAWEEEESRKAIDEQLLGKKDAGSVEPSKDGTPAEKTREEALTAGPLLIRFTELVDYDAENPAGEDIGDVDNFVFRSGDGHIASVIISSGGFLGMAESIHAIPPTMVNRGGKEEVLVIRATETDRAGVASLDLTAAEADRDRWMRDLVRGERDYADDAADDAELTNFPEFRLRAGQTLRYRVELGADPGNDMPATRDASSAQYVITIRELDDEGVASASLEIRPEAKGTVASRTLRYDARFDADGNLASVVSSVDNPVATTRYGNDLVEKHLQAIFAVGLHGSELDREADAVSCGDLRIRYSGSTRYGSNDLATYEILGGDDDQKLGTATYDLGDGCLVNLDFQGTGEMSSLKIHRIREAGEQR